VWQQTNVQYRFRIWLNTWLLFSSIQSKKSTFSKKFSIKLIKRELGTLSSNKWRDSWTVYTCIWRSNPRIKSSYKKLCKPLTSMMNKSFTFSKFIKSVRKSWNWSKNNLKKHVILSCLSRFLITKRNWRREPE